MIFRKLTILISFLLFTSFGIKQFHDNQNHFRTNGKPVYSKNLDSLYTFVVNNGWSLVSLDYYHHALINDSLDLQRESEKIQALPGNFERLFLQALILKRNENYKAMFDSLIACFDLSPNYYPYYDELEFSAQTTGQISFLENLLERSKSIDKSQRYYLQGKIFLNKAKQKEALTHFLAADSIDVLDKNIVFNLVQTYKGLANYKKSSILIEKLKKNYGDDEILKPKLLIAEGTLAYLSNDLKNAEIKYRQALEFALTLGDKISQSKALTDLGICADINGELEKAREYFNKAVLAGEEVNDLESVAFANSERGVSYTFSNQLVDAKTSYLASYSLYKKLGNSVRLALLSNNLGKLYMSFFDHKSALKYFEEGIQFAGNDNRAQALNLIGLADVYANLSNYSKALKYYREAQKISSEIQDISLNSEISTGLGALNFNLDRYSNALFYYQFAAELQEQLPNSYLLPDIYHKLGLSYFRMDSLSVAANYFKRAINMASISGNEYAVAISSLDLAELYLSKKDFKLVSAYLSKSKLIAQRNNWEHIIAEIYLLEGYINAEQRIFDSAKQNFLNALSVSKKLNDYSLQTSAYYSLGRLFHDNGFIPAAKSYFKSGISVIEDISRPLFEDSEVQISFFNARRDLYDSYAELLLEQNEFKEAYEIIDKSRSRNTMQNLINLKLASLSEEDSSIGKLYEHEWMISSGIYSVKETDSLRQVLWGLKNTISEKHPELVKLFDRNTTESIENLQKTLNEKENFITIFITKSKSYLFLITRKKFETTMVDINRKQILELSSKISPYFEQTLSSQYFFNKDLFSFNSGCAHKLYESLLKPALDKIPLNEKLIISSPKELYVIPFEFLIRDFSPDQSNYDYSNKNFLVFDYAISYSPSASIYIEEARNNLRNDGKVILVGDPSIDNQSDEFAERRGLLDESVSTPRNFAFLPLRYSAEEVETISSIIKTDKVFLSKDATETNFKKHAELSSIIHLSTHSLLYKKQPLIFFSNFYDSENNGFLEAAEIVQMKLNSDLVVLSSCSSGLGRIDESEGVIGMTKAFLDAGSKSVVVSLWEVNDKYTSKFMTLFYEKLRDGFDKSEALRLAKVEFIKKHSPNPYFWAAFVLAGNTSKLSFERSSIYSSYLVIIILAGLISSLVYFAMRKGRAQKTPNILS